MGSNYPDAAVEDYKIEFGGKVYQFTCEDGEFKLTGGGKVVDRLSLNGYVKAEKPVA